MGASVLLLDGLLRGLKARKGAAGQGQSGSGSPGWSRHLNHWLLVLALSLGGGFAPVAQAKGPYPEAVTLEAVALAALFTLKLPWPEVGRFSWFQTATKSFGGAILAAMGVVIVLSRLDITTDVMLLLAAEFLAKVELRVAGRSRWQSFWQMLAASAVGIGSAIGLAPWFLMSRVSE